jgi:TolB-like protein/DNA-binding winged helix-turn-helix (wHTH) protein
MQVPAKGVLQVRFGSFRVDLASHELRSNGRKINLQEKPFQVLAVLLEQPGDLVTREDLRHKLWPADTFVDFEHSINTAINKVREALEDSGDHPRYIETIPRRGYRFIAPVEVSSSAAAPGGAGFTPAAAEIATAEAQKVPSVWRAAPYQGKLVRVGIPILAVLAVAAVATWHMLAPKKVEASIAVLPFADLSATHDQEYLSDGLAEEILDHLTRIPNLKVTARTSAFQFKGKNEDTKIIGEKLKVATLLEGSVRRDGDRIRITVQLIKADDGFHLWSDSYDRDLKDLLTVEDDIAKAVAFALQPKLLSGRSSLVQTALRTTNPAAYEALLHARYFIYMQDEESGKKALITLTRRSTLTRIMLRPMPCGRPSSCGGVI